MKLNSVIAAVFFITGTAFASESPCPTCTSVRCYDIKTNETVPCYEPALGGEGGHEFEGPPEAPGGGGWDANDNFRRDLLELARRVGSDKKLDKQLIAALDPDAPLFAAKRSRRKMADYADFIIEKYRDKGSIAVYRILTQRFSIGWTRDMAVDSAQLPWSTLYWEVNRSVGSWGVHEQWVFDGFYLYFRNGILTSYSD